MVTLARWCVHRSKLVVGGWLALLVVLGGVLGVAGTAFSDSTRLPASDSATAYALLGSAGSQAASAKTGTIVWHTTSGSAVSAATHAALAPMLTEVAGVEGVSAV